MPTTLAAQLAEHADVIREHGVDTYLIAVLVLAFAGTLVYVAKVHRGIHENDKALVAQRDARIVALEEEVSEVQQALVDALRERRQG